MCKISYLWTFTCERETMVLNNASLTQHSLHSYKIPFNIVRTVTEIVWENDRSMKNLEYNTGKSAEWFSLPASLSQ